MSQDDITLVNISTPVSRDESHKHEAYLPLGCLYLISALQQHGIKVDFRDYQIFAANTDFPLNVDSFQSFLVGAAPIVGVSCMVSMLPFVVLGTKKFKENNPHHKLILGGPGPSGVARDIVSSFPWVDMVGIGEGEITLVEVVEALKNGGDLKQVQGIVYRDGSDIHQNPPRPRIKNPDDISFPAYDRINFSDYNSNSVITGRGCPYKCAFCDVGPLWGNRTSFRSIDNVMEEIKLLKNRYGQNKINLADDTFDLKRDRTEAICEAIEDLGLNWTCLARVDLLDEALLRKMTRAGCDAIFLGIESGSDTVLNRIKKKFTIKEATKKVEMSKRFFDRVITSFIWGFPFETVEDFKETLFSVISMWHLGAMAGLKLLSPMPLSPLGIQYRDHLEFSEDLCSVFASLGNMTPGQKTKRADLPESFKELIKSYPDIFSGFYYIKSDTILEKAQYLKRFSRRMKVPM